MIDNAMEVVIMQETERRKKIEEVIARFGQQRNQAEAERHKMESASKNQAQHLTEMLLAMRELTDLTVPIHSEFRFSSDKSVTISFDRVLFPRTYTKDFESTPETDELEDNVQNRLAGIRHVYDVTISDTHLRIEFRLPRGETVYKRRDWVLDQAKGILKTLLVAAGYLEPIFKLGVDDPKDT